jgi:hypothetical protein
MTEMPCGWLFSLGRPWRRPPLRNVSSGRPERVFSVSPVVPLRMAD